MEELKRLLLNSPGCCPEFSGVRLTQLLRMCPLQVEAIQALESAFGKEDGAVEEATGMMINMFVPLGGGISFRCAQYKAEPRPSRDMWSKGEPVMTGYCRIEKAVVDQLIQLTIQEVK